MASFNPSSAFKITIRNVAFRSENTPCYQAWPLSSFVLRAGVHVSPLQLGAMSIGDKWEAIGMGSMDKEYSFKPPDAYYDNGGNFIDTANSYQDESSEKFIGEWAEKRSIRDQLFIATKFSTCWKDRNDSVQQKVMYIGNSVKSLYISVEAYLKKLRTEYIDLLYLHCIEEVMQSHYALVLHRKVLYLGISDSPAWVVAKANQYARDHAPTPFVVYQGSWNIMDRSFECEIIPMARSEGMTLAPWSVLAGGRIRTDEEEEKRRSTGEKGRMILDNTWERTEQEKFVCKALDKVAADIGAKQIRSVAIAYLLQKTAYIFPIIGGWKVEHMLANIETLDLTLTNEQIKILEGVAELDPGFPSTTIGDGSDTSEWLKLSATFGPRPSIRQV